MWPPIGGNRPIHWNKPGEQGPVSEADLAVDACLRDILLTARPDYGWISEESVDERDGPAHRSHSFIIDPIDGTRSFLEGARTFAHSLAVAENGRIVAGVVFLPMHGRLFHAAKGGGAFLNDTTLRAGAHSAMDGANILAARPTFAPDNWARPTPVPNRHYRASLAYRMSLVAQGRFDAMITPAPHLVLGHRRRRADRRRRPGPKCATPLVTRSILPMPTRAPPASSLPIPRCGPIFTPACRRQVFQAASPSSKLGPTA